MDVLQKSFTWLSQHAIWFAVPAIVLSVGYYWLLPKPLPGIPYDPKTAKSILGDLPKIMKYAKKHKEGSPAFAEHCESLNSPICQMFISQFNIVHRLPLVILTDVREIEDIATRRTKEFDRADMGSEGFNNVIGEATIGMPSHDRFKAQRKLWAGTMTPEFLHKIAAMYLHDTGTSLVKLWKRKAELAQHRPFEASDDLRYEGFDTVWAFSVGKDLGTIKSQLDHLNNIDATDLEMPATTTEPIKFPKATEPELYKVIMNIISKLEALVASMFPQITWFILSHSPWFTAILKSRDTYMDTLISDARARFEDKTSGPADETVATSAMDQVLRRLHNSKIATLNPNTKEPDRHLKDELFLFLMAGYETTATTICWALKFLAAHPEVQTKLRSSLHAAFGDEQAPTATQILDAHLPYLDACIAEILRCSMTSGGTARQAVTDTSVLGYPVPKGTILLMLTMGPTYMFNKHLPLPEEARRSGSSKQYAGVRGQQYSWPLEGRKEFRPERWLRPARQSAQESQDGQAGKEGDDVVFDEHAGPNMPFGLGPRGCFGKRLAMVKLRITLTLLVLGLEFLEVSGKGREGKEEFDLAAWGGQEKLTRMPRRTYVRLRAL